LAADNRRRDQSIWELCAIECLFMIFEPGGSSFGEWCLVRYFERFRDEAMRQDGRYARTGRGINAHNALFLLSLPARSQRFARFSHFQRTPHAKVARRT